MRCLVPTLASITFVAHLRPGTPEVQVNGIWDRYAAGERVAQLVESRFRQLPHVFQQSNRFIIHEIGHRCIC